MSFTLAVVGATGLVGRTMLRVLEEQHFPFTDLRLLASARSAGVEVEALGRRTRVEELRNDSFHGVTCALFSAGGAASLRFAPAAAAAGCVVIDNSSAWRMHPLVPLVVPEVNADALTTHHGIVANPNCSTIQMVVALKPLHEAFGLKRVVVSTYQSVSGAGQKGIDHLMSELHGEHPQNRISPHQLAFNTVFHSITDPSGYSEEELKMKFETRKIMSLPGLPIAVTCVRVPVLGGHGESVSIETERPLRLSAMREVLAASPGIVMVDDPYKAEYPTPQSTADKDEVYVGRVRIDDSVENGAQMWIVADNVRKGAATNAVQIAQILRERQLWNFDAPTSW